METSFMSFYTINKKLLSIIGQWPYQTKLKKYFRSTLVYISLFSLLIPELLGLKKYWGNMDIVIECIPPIIIIFAVLFLLTNCIFKMDRIELILSKMQSDWDFWIKNSKIEILHDYAKRGRTYNLAYTIYLFFTTTFYIGIPIIPQVLDVIKPLNESRAKHALYFTEYYLDEEKYFYWILIHGYISSFTCLFIFISIETIFSAVIHHACGVFSTIGFKLNNILKNDYDYCKINKKAPPPEIDNEIKICIERHTEIIKFISDICDCFSTAFFLLLGCNMIIISVTGVQTVIKLDKLNEALRFGGFTLGQIIHLLYLSVPCQQLIDHSTSLSNSIYNGYWYQLSLESQKLLLMIMKRSSKPSQFTAGKLYVFSIKNFASILRTSMSYFTMLSSVR